MQPRPLHAFGLGALVVAAIVGAVVLLAPSRRLASERHLKPVERLSDTARAALRTQMRTHARGMLELVSAVTVLDYEAVGASAQRLLEEPRIARPLRGDANELNGSLPARFFDQQDELPRDLQSLQRAAAAHDPEALADTFAATSRTCIHCHESYLTGR
jgi:cytochrome c556